MSAEIIQFVPRPDPCRPTLLEGKEAEATEFLECAPLLAISRVMASDECFVSEYDPDFVEEILRVQKLPPERTFKNSHDLLAWLNAPDKDSA